MADAPNSSSPSLPELEAMIRSASGYVQPTDDLRPRTLEAASERRVCRRGRSVVISLAALLVCLPVVGLFVEPGPSTGVDRSMSSSELQRQARVLAAHRGVEPGWGLFEAFASLRREQAQRLGAESLRK